MYKNSGHWCNNQFYDTGVQSLIISSIWIGTIIHKKLCLVRDFCWTKNPNPKYILIRFDWLVWLSLHHKLCFHIIQCSSILTRLTFVKNFIRLIQFVHVSWNLLTKMVAVDTVHFRNQLFQFNLISSFFGLTQA